MMRDTFWMTRHPSGRKEYTPAATFRRYPPRTMRTWEGTSASAGASFNVGIKDFERRMRCRHNTRCGRSLADRQNGPGPVRMSLQVPLSLPTSCWLETHPKPYPVHNLSIE